MTNKKTTNDKRQTRRVKYYELDDRDFKFSSSEMFKLQQDLEVFSLIYSLVCGCGCVVVGQRTDSWELRSTTTG